MYSVYTLDMRVNVYIRKEDEAKWNAIEDIPEWIHRNINGTRHGLENGKPVIRNISNGSVARRNLCEHYQPKGKCMVKGCKK